MNESINQCKLYYNTYIHISFDFYSLTSAQGKARQGKGYTCTEERENR